MGPVLGQVLIAPGGGADQARVHLHLDVGVGAVVGEEARRVDQLVVSVIAEPFGPFGKGQQVEKGGHLWVAVTARHGGYPSD
ncbi:hypothetical protein D3C85_1779700 [compost metagenome]